MTLNAVGLQGGGWNATQPHLRVGETSAYLLPGAPPVSLSLGGDEMRGNLPGAFCEAWALTQRAGALSPGGHQAQPPVSASDVVLSPRLVQVLGAGRAVWRPCARRHLQPGLEKPVWAARLAWGVGRGTYLSRDWWVCGGARALEPEKLG